MRRETPNQGAVIPFQGGGKGVGLASVDSSPPNAFLVLASADARANQMFLMLESADSRAKNSFLVVESTDSRGKKRFLGVESADSSLEAETPTGKNKGTMNKKAVRDGFTGCYGTYTTEAVVQQDIALHLTALLDKHILEKPKQAVEVGCGSGFLTEQLLERFPTASWLLNDIAPSSNDYVMAVAQQNQALDATFELGDAEVMEFSKGIDLFASSSAVQWFTDLEGFLKRLSEAMNEGGTIAISTFGPNNLTEVRELTGNGLPYLSLEEFRTAVGRYFDIVECTEEQTVIYFDEPVEVLRHIKQTGVNGAFRQCWTKGKLTRFAEGYQKFHSDKGYSLTYHPMYVVARK